MLGQFEYNHFGDVLAATISTSTSIWIIRYSDKGTDKEVLTFNVYAIQKGKDEDPYLKENDIIIVPSHAMKSFLSTVKDVFSASFGIGSVSVSM